MISKQTSEKIRHALESVVAQGTGGNAFVDGYRVGGKTGTAQKAQNGRYLDNNHIVSFIGFAPADDPQPQDARPFSIRIRADFNGRTFIRSISQWSADVSSFPPFCIKSGPSVILRCCSCGLVVHLFSSPFLAVHLFVFVNFPFNVCFVAHTPSFLQIARRLMGSG